MLKGKKCYDQCKDLSHNAILLLDNIWGDLLDKYNL